jgi:hypothetical protein
MVKPKRTRNKRFSVTLTEDDYKRLKDIAKKRRIPMSLQYVVNCGIIGLLENPEVLESKSTFGNQQAKAIQ